MTLTDVCKHFQHVEFNIGLLLSHVESWDKIFTTPTNCVCTATCTVQSPAKNSASIFSDAFFHLYTLRSAHALPQHYWVCFSNALNSVEVRSGDQEKKKILIPVECKARASLNIFQQRLTQLNAIKNFSTGCAIALYMSSLQCREHF